MAEPTAPVSGGPVTAGPVTAGPAVAGGPDAEVDPRVARSRRLVLDAAQQVLCEHGFRGATIEAIAGRCGVAKTTIYRHWGCREDLLSEAIAAATALLPAAIETGHVRDDLVTSLDRLAELLDTSFGHLLASLVDAGERDTRMADVQRDFAAERRRRTTTMLARGVERGQLPADTDVDLLCDQLIGPVMYRRFLSRAPLEHDWIERHVDTILARPPRRVG